MRRLDRLLLISASMVLAVAPAASGPARQEPELVGIPAPGGASLPDDRYQLRTGDAIDLNFPFVPDFNQTISVQPGGFVTLRVLGSLHVEGMTVPELTDRLRAEYGSILRDPVITVELKEFEQPYFIVAGGVERPGKYDLRGETTVTQAVAVAGGLKRRAKESQAVVFRRLAAGDYEATKLDLKKMMKKGDLNADVRLQPGDVLFIPGGRGGGVEYHDVASSLWILLTLL